jgi:5-methylcytosine-specific restriction protein A
VYYWGLVLSLLGTDTFLPDLCCDGKVSTREVNVYERNPLNRKACIALKGTTCVVCGLNFEKKYGSVGAGYIEIHHIKPVSHYDGEQPVNPLTDLVPVCANCHAMLHRRNPPYSVDELKKMIQKACKS